MKNSNIKLLLLLLALIAVGVAYYFLNTSKQTRNFRKELVDIDTTQVTGITLYPKVENGKELKLTKSGGTWSIAQEDGSTKEVDKAQMKALMSTILAVKPSRLAATKKDKWGEYEIGEDATRLKVHEGDKTTLDLYVGKFSIQQQQAPAGAPPNFQQQQQQQQRPKLSTYVRVAGEEQVYATEGMLGMSVNRKADDFLPPPPPPEATDSTATDTPVNEEN